MSHWMEARMDSFGSIGVAVNPGVSVGTTKPRIAVVGLRPDHRDLGDRRPGRSTAWRR